MSMTPNNFQFTLFKYNNYQTNTMHKRVKALERIRASPEELTYI